MTSTEFFVGSPFRKVGNNSRQGATYIFGSITKVVLKVEDSGSGGGTIKSDPPGINCGKMCRASFDPGVNVKLTAHPNKGSKFTHRRASSGLRATSRGEARAAARRREPR